MLAAGVHQWCCYCVAQEQGVAAQHLVGVALLVATRCVSHRPMHSVASAGLLRAQHRRLTVCVCA